MKIFFVLVTFISLLVVSSCVNDEAENGYSKSSAKDILTFEIPNIETSIDNVQKKIIIKVGANLTNLNLITKITISEKATLSNRSLISDINYDGTVTFEVIAEDMSRVVYTVIVERLPVVGLKIFEIKITNPQLGSYLGVIDYMTKTINVILNKDDIVGFPLSIKKVIIETSTGYSSSLVTGNTIDIDNSGSLVLTKPDGTIENYQIFIKSSGNRVQFFAIPSTFQLTEIDLFASSVLYSTSTPTAGAGLQPTDLIVRTLITEDVSNMAPAVLVVSKLATISPSKTTPQNFNNDVTYTITSESGIPSTVKVRLVKEKILVHTDYNGQINNLQNYGNGYIRYVAVSKIASIKFKNVQNNQLVNGTIINNYKQGTSDEYYLSYTVPTGTLGTFKLIATLEDGSVINTYYTSMHTL